MIPEYEDPIDGPELSARGKCIQFIHEYLPENLLRNSAFIVATVTAAIFSSNLAYVFVIAASSQVLSASLLKIYLEYDENGANQLQMKISNFRKNYPWLQLVAFMVTVAVFFIFPLASAVLGGLLGLYVGLLSDNTYYRIMQKNFVDV